MDAKIRTYLDRLADSENRPSSYVFAGQDGKAKEDGAFYFIAKIAGKSGDSEFLDRAKSKNHPDVVIIEPEIEEKKGKKREKEISIAQVRGALERLKFFPYELEKKFCVVMRAEKMSAEASNALLKSLEEPSEKAIFVLLANDAETVLPTIVSRCAVLRFAQTELPKWREENRKKLMEIFREEIFERFDCVEEASKNKSELIILLKDWELVMAGSLRKLTGNPENGRKIKKVVELIENTREAVNRLEYTNASARAVGENLMLQLGL